MLLFITCHGHSYTVKSLLEGTFGAPTPPCEVTTYEELFHADCTRQAVHLFTDIERLYDWELVLAADLYRAVRDAGLPCLNDPARVMARYELLRSLYAAGVNPFTAYRAEDHPRPGRFPVFVRAEAGHTRPLSGLLPDQAALDAALGSLRERGMPLRGLIVVEFAGEPLAPGMWRKFGTFRMGDAVLLEHGVIEDRWIVKEGIPGLATDAMVEEVSAAVTSNCFAKDLQRAFDIAGIEWGRADHAAFEGRQIVYEINTNPKIAGLNPEHASLRGYAMLQFARERMAKQMWRLDFGDGSLAPLAPSKGMLQYRSRNAGPGWRPIRP
jgi:hypothetical protein